MKASLNNYRQAPRKVRLVVDAVRGKSVEDALASLRFMTKKSAHPLRTLLLSAVANAKQMNEGVKEELLFVRTITVDKGITLHRHMPRAFGRATPIRKETSKVNVVLGERTPRPKKKEKNEKSKAATSPKADAVKKEDATENLKTTA